MEGSWIRLIAVTMLLYLGRETECRNPVLHRVGGGKYTWEPNVNFTEWANHQHFYLGDWLYFGFDKHRYNVLQVNKTNYDNCSGKDFIENVTRGGRDVFNLTDLKPYYFICARGGYCFNGGMKVAVFVETDPPPPTPSPHLISSASPPSNNFARFFIAFTSALFYYTCI